MSHWNCPEEQMRRWMPQRPSPELRTRLFGKPAPIHAAARSLSDFSRWLVPAFGCFLLVVGGLSQRAPGLMAEGHETNLLGVHGSGNSRIMMAQSRQHSEINAIPSKRMEYSIAGRMPQTASPTYISHTNQLIQQ